jgi:hypothetical protein
MRSAKLQSRQIKEKVINANLGLSDGPHDDVFSPSQYFFSDVAERSARRRSGKDIVRACYEATRPFSDDDAGAYIPEAGQ